MSVMLAMALVVLGGGKAYGDVVARLPLVEARDAQGASAPQFAGGRNISPAATMSPQHGFPPDVPQGTGPRGTSGEVREDVVGYASPMRGAPDPRYENVAVAVGHPSLPLGGFVEITALDTGRTIVAMIVSGEADGAVVSLSQGAARALGVADRAAVRVRTVVVSAQDQVALRSGHVASLRLDAPVALLVALRRRLPGQAEPALAPRSEALVRPTPPAAPSPVPVARTGGYVVQIAALSSAERAATLARELGGRVVPLGRLSRVQIGPFADATSARRARDDAARRGYKDARILRND